MQSTKCKIFLKGFCPRKELCQNSHDIKNCMSGLNCKIKKECPDRHPPLCKNFVKNTCGFLVGSKFIVYSNCAFFHPPGVNQEPTSINSVMLTTTATVQNTPQDARSEIEVKSGISPADQVTKQLSDLNSKIIKMEQNLSLLADKMVNMDSKIKLIEESTKKIDTMDTKISQVDEAIKQSDSMQTNQANQDLRQEMDSMKTDITDNNYRLNRLVEKVTFIKNDLRQKMDTMEDDIIEKIPSMIWFEIRNGETVLPELQTQIHKIVKEYQQLHKA